MCLAMQIMQYTTVCKAAVMGLLWDGNGRGSATRNWTTRYETSSFCREADQT